MAEDTIRSQMQALIAGLSPEQIKDLERDFAMAALKAKKDAVPEYLMSGPKDPAVQVAAAWALKFWRNPDFRRHVTRSMSDRPLSYGDIGELLHVSRERTRQLYADLCPLDYEIEKQDRGSRVATG